MRAYHNTTIIHRQLRHSVVFTVRWPINVYRYSGKSTTTRHIDKREKKPNNNRTKDTNSSVCESMIISIQFLHIAADKNIHVYVSMWGWASECVSISWDACSEAITCECRCVIGTISEIQLASRFRVVVVRRKEAISYMD